MFCKQMIVVPSDGAVYTMDLRIDLVKVSSFMVILKTGSMSGGDDDVITVPLPDME